VAGRGANEDAAARRTTTDRLDPARFAHDHIHGAEPPLAERRGRRAGRLRRRPPWRLGRGRAGRRDRHAFNASTRISSVSRALSAENSGVVFSV
jgi:hypothetical protein